MMLGLESFVISGFDLTGKKKKLWKKVQLTETKSCFIETCVWRRLSLFVSSGLGD